MLVASALAFVLAIAFPAPVAGLLSPGMTGAIPDEPGARVLFDGPVHQAIAADLDGDGAREIVALTEGQAAAVAIVAWHETDAGWRQLGEPLSALPGAMGPEDVWRGWRVRLLLRTVGDQERVTLVAQPDLRSADEDGECCLTLDDVTLSLGRLQLTPVAPTRQAVEAVVVLDLDGDGTDELVATRSVLPRGDVSYPTDVFVHRWAGDRFTVREQQLRVGSGDTPFLLGDTDGEAGEELGVIATAGRPELHRIALATDGETLRVDDAGTVAISALGVPLGNGRGVAVVHATGTLSVHAWPVGDRLGPPVGSVDANEVRLLGVVEVARRPQLMATSPSREGRLLVYDLPDPSAPLERAFGSSRATVTLAEGPLAPYVGLLPGGFGGRLPAAIQSGRLIGGSSEQLGGTPFPMLVGAQPIGLAGSNDGHLAVLHGVSSPPLGTSGGRLDPPSPAADAAISVAPLDEALVEEVADAHLDASVTGGASGGRERALFVGAEGLLARIEAPAGSRVYVGVGDEMQTTMAVPEDGVLDVPLPPPDSGEEGSASRVGVTVTTPAGHSYLEVWEIRVLTEPPALAAATRTPAGSGDVEVAGDAPPYASVTVAGEPVGVDDDGRFSTTVSLPPWPTDVEVVATDPLGNTAARTVSGVGWLDYRDLPWIPIVAAGIGLAALVLYLRVPRPEPVVRRADDDAVLEELEGD